MAPDAFEGILPGDENENEEEGETIEVTFQLTATDRRFLETAARFLLGMQTPARVKKLRRVGYTQQEHALGWSLFNKAVGQYRPLAQYLGQDDPEEELAASADQTARLREVDAFENLWFPRTRAIIRRVTPSAERDRFASTFFANLDQQPFGPLVVGSVATYLTRVEALSSSTLKGATEVRETLRQRGLTDAEIARVRGLLGQLREGPLEAPPQNEGQVEAGREQEKALADLRDWFNDWATTLRPVLPMRDRIALGLTARKRGSAGEGDEGDDDEGGEGDNDALDGVVG
jgi:hypothetical protein